MDAIEPLGPPSSLSPSESDLFRTLSLIVESRSYVGNEESAVGDSMADISSGTVVLLDGDSSCDRSFNRGVDLRVCSLSGTLSLP